MNRVLYDHDFPGLDVLGLGAQVLLEHLMSYKFIRKMVLAWLKMLAKKHKIEAVWKGYRAFQERWIYHYHPEYPSQFHTVLPDGSIKQTNKLTVGEVTLLKTYAREQEFTGQEARHEYAEYVHTGNDGKPIVVQIWPGTKGNLDDHVYQLAWDELNDGACLYCLHKRVGESTLMVVKSKQEIEKDGYSPLDFHIDDCAPDGEQLGAGSFATVQAYTDQNGEKVAVKRLIADAATNHFFTYRERDICCRIKDEQKKGNASPFLVQIREVFYSQGSKCPELCIVMSRYPTNLERKIAGEELAEAKILQWMAQLFLALEHLHTHI